MIPSRIYRPFKGKEATRRTENGRKRVNIWCTTEQKNETCWYTTEQKNCQKRLHMTLAPSHPPGTNFWNNAPENALGSSEEQWTLAHLRNAGPLEYGRYLQVSCPEEGKGFISCCRLSFICIVFVLIWRLILLLVMKIKELKNNLWNIVKGLGCTVVQIFNAE
jgi:hypothetical protein